MLKYLLILPISFCALIGWFMMDVPFDTIKKLKTEYPLFDGDRKMKGMTSKKPQNWLAQKSLRPKIFGPFVVSEDWSFFAHQGVDIKQIKNAVSDYINKRKRLRGASTISQQLSKNLFLTSERSYWRKLRELIHTLAIEKILSKKRILEIYLNIVELGDGVYGIGQASNFYFQKKAHSLNAKEASFLAMLLPNPKKYSVSFRKKTVSPYAKKTIEIILKRMRVAKYIDKQGFKKALVARFNWETYEEVLDPIWLKEVDPPDLIPGEKIEFDDHMVFERPDVVGRKSVSSETMTKSEEIEDRFKDDGEVKNESIVPKENSEIKKKPFREGDSSSSR